MSRQKLPTIARAILSDLKTIGPAVFERFATKAPGTLWYYREIADVFTQRQAPMVRELA